MPISEDRIAAHRVHVDAYATRWELDHNPHTTLAVIRAKLRETLADKIGELTLRHEEGKGGGKHYWMDVLVLTPLELTALIEREAKRLLREYGYAGD